MQWPKQMLWGVALLLLGLNPACASTSAPNVVVILTDDHGWADLGCQGVRQDIRTPELDALAAEGVRCTAGYVTAPMCVPSRAGLLTGRYQQRFGLDVNPEGPLPEGEVTLAERLRAAGWRTGMVGKWHLEPNRQTRAWNEGAGQGVGTEEQFARFGPGGQGFTEFFCGGRSSYRATFDGLGKTFEKPRTVVQDGDRIAVQTRAAVDFIRRNGRAPFFLYLAYFAPHTPLEATPDQLAATPADLPRRRRHALAMLKAVDEGVGQVRAALRQVGAADHTLIVFVSDNGAPLARTMPDDPIELRMDDSGWDGSRNDPFIGEKGMLTEGGIRVPMIWHWPGRLPAGRVHKEPVSTLDIVPTALAAAGLPRDLILDGRNVLPELAGEPAPERALFWRVWHQAAVRRGSWKLLRVGERRLLFDLAGEGERTDLAARHPERVAALDRELAAWLATLSPPGLREGSKQFQQQVQRNYSHHLPAFAPPPSRGAARPNFLLILADDHGYGDVSAYGASDVRTPNLDRIGSEGMLFTTMRANATVCSPSRAALLTGRHPDRIGVPGVIRTQPEDSWGYFDPQVPTLADELKQAGYHTALVGKWHLGLESPNLPNERGFDFFHGFLGDMMDSYTTHLRHGNNYLRRNAEVIEPKGHATDLFSEWAAGYLLRSNFSS